jgi:hypothetical protein
MLVNDIIFSSPNMAATCSADRSQLALQQASGKCPYRALFAGRRGTMD